MDLDFNQGGMPPESSDKPVETAAPAESTPSTSSDQASMPSGSAVNAASTPSEQPVANKPIDNIDIPLNQTPSDIPPPPPVPPTPSLVDDSMPSEQYIETPSDEPHRSKLLPIIVIILVLLIIAAIVGGWFYYQKVGPNAPANTDNVTLDNSTGQPVDKTSLNNNATTPTTTNDLTTVAGRDAQRKADLATIQSYLEKYKTQNGAYPISQDVAKLNESNTVVTALVPTYASSLPTDPSGATAYYGYTSADGTSYKLTASLEDLSDPTGVPTGNYNIYTVTNTATSGQSATSDATSDSINNDFSSSSSTTN